MAVRARSPKQPNSIDVDVGRRVRIERIARGLSQGELANQIGVTFQQLQKYEAGENRISMGRLMRVGSALGLDVSDLLGASTQRTLPAQPDPKEQADLSEAMRMLGRLGALRLLKAFVAIPPNPPRLRDSILALVEGIAATGLGRKNPERGQSTKRSQA